MLPHIWPQEDLAVAEVVTERGGQYVQLIDQRTIATSPESNSFGSLVDYVRKTPNEIQTDIIAAYRRSAADNSITHDAWKRMRAYI